MQYKNISTQFPQENYTGEDTLYSNRQRSESSVALEEEEANNEMRYFT